MKYPEIGTTVKFIRVDTEKKEVTGGEGTVRAIFIDPKGRLMVQVMDEDKQARNIDLACVNPSLELRTKYEALNIEIEEITEEGNNLVKETVEVYNKKVDDAYSRLLGNPLLV